MPEFIADAFVNILPDFTAFDALLQAKITAALAQVQAQQTGAAAASAGTTAASAAASIQQTLPGFVAIETQAKAAAQAVTQQLAPALNVTLPAASRQAKQAIDDNSNSLKNFQNQLNSFKTLAPILAAAFSIQEFAKFDNAITTSQAVFGDASKSITAFAKQQSDALGLSELQIVKSATAIGGALTGMGVSGKVAAAVATDLTGRAADLAAAFGTTADTALKAFQLGLEGNSRGLKQFNIDISANDQAQEALRLGYRGTVGSLSDVQKAQINYNLILEKSSQFAGDAAKTQNTLAGELRGLKADLTNTAVAFGKDLAPAVGIAVEPIRTFLQVLQAIPQPLQAVIVDLGFAAIAVTALSTKLTALAISDTLPLLLGKLSLGFGGITQGAATATTSVGGLSAGTSALGEILGGVATVPAVAFLGALAAIGAQSDDTKLKLTELGNVADKDLVDAFQKSAENSNSIVNTFKDLIGQLNPFGGRPEDIAATQNIQHQVEALDKVAQGANGLATAQRIVTQSQLSGSVAAGDLAAELTKLQEADDARRTSLGESTSAQEANTASLKENAIALKALFTDTDALKSAQQALNDAHQNTLDLQQKLKDLNAKGGAEELKEAQDKLTNATDAHSQAIQRQIAAQKALDELKAPATQRELTDATDGVTLAQLSLNDALRAQKAAQDALNRTNEIHLNLTGLNLAQIRDAIDNARASQQANQTVSKGKTQAELQDDVTKANIAVTQATEKLTDSQKTLNDTVNKGNVDKIQTKETIDKITAAQYSLAQANNAVTSTTAAQDKAQFELNLKLAGQTTFAKDIDTLNKSIAKSKEAEAKQQDKLTDATAKQKDDLATIEGTLGRISEVLRRQLAENIGLFKGNIPLQRSIIDQVLNQVAPGQTLPLVLSSSKITELFNDIVSDPSKFFELLKQFGLTIPGHAEGAIIDRPTFAQLGEGSLAELILPLTKPDRAWELLSQSLPHMTLPLRQKLEPVIRPDLPKNLGHRQTPMAIASTDNDIEHQILNVLNKILEKPAGDVDVNVFPTAGMSETQLTQKIRDEITRLLGGR